MSEGKMAAIWMTVSILVIAGVLFAFAVPLAKGNVQRNTLYGFRTTKTLSNPQVWQQANKFAGEVTILCAAAMGLLALVYLILALRLDVTRTTAIYWGFAVEILPPLALFVVVMIYNARLNTGR